MVSKFNWIAFLLHHLKNELHLMLDTSLSIHSVQDELVRTDFRLLCHVYYHLSALNPQEIRYLIAIRS
jgi:hypothetical protein